MFEHSHEQVCNIFLFKYVVQFLYPFSRNHKLQIWPKAVRTARRVRPHMVLGRICMDQKMEVSQNWGYPKQSSWLVVWNMAFMTFHILGMSSSQLTNSYFSEGVKPPNNHPFIDGSSFFQQSMYPHDLGNLQTTHMASLWLRSKSASIPVRKQSLSELVSFLKLRCWKLRSEDICHASGRCKWPANDWIMME